MSAFTHYTVIAARRYLLPGAIDLGTIIVLFGIWCEGRSLFFTQASISVESSYCLVFGVRGDRPIRSSTPIRVGCLDSAEL